MIQEKADQGAPLYMIRRIRGRLATGSGVRGHFDTLKCMLPRRGEKFKKSGQKEHRGNTVVFSVHCSLQLNSAWRIKLLSAGRVFRKTSKLQRALFAH